MKTILLTTAALMSLCTSAWGLENTIKPTVTDLGVTAPKSGLIVGNSYSFYNCGVHSYLREFTKEGKVEWKTRLLTMSSARLSFHNVKDYLMPDKAMDPYAKNVKQGKPMFDVVVLQGQSSEPINPKGMKNFQKAAKTHIDTIRKAGATPLLVATWARQDKPEDTKALADETIKVGNANKTMVLPVGLAFAESLKVRPDLVMHQDDKSHPSAAGSYLYGAMLYAVIHKKNPEGYKALGGCEKPLKPEDAKHLQTIAWKTVKEFYGW